MSQMPLASIIIDNYNYGRFLAEAIDSALAQTYRHVEVIVVDDGSTDHSRDVIVGYGNRVQAILKKNGGQGSTFNAGFATSRGEIVVFLDADDVLLPTAIERAVPCFADPAVVKAHWPMRIVDEAGQPNGQLCPGPVLQEGDLRSVAFRLGPTNHLSAPTSGNAWSRRFLGQVLPMNEAVYRIAADTYLFELAPFFGPLRAVTDPQTLYRQHGHNDHSTLQMGDKIQREVQLYEHYSGVLEQYCRTIGVAVDLDTWHRNSWWHRHAQAIREIMALPGAGRPIILADDATWEEGPMGDRRRIPFLQRDGQYWGPPPDNATAIDELERLRGEGAALMVFAWPAFWWLDYYAAFSHHLRATYACPLQNERLVAFDLCTPIVCARA